TSSSISSGRMTPHTLSSSIRAQQIARTLPRMGSLGEPQAKLRDSKMQPRSTKRHLRNLPECSAPKSIIQSESEQWGKKHHYQKVDPHVPFLNPRRAVADGGGGGGGGLGRMVECPARKLAGLFMHIDVV